MLCFAVIPRYHKRPVPQWGMGGGKRGARDYEQDYYRSQNYLLNVNPDMSYQGLVAPNDESPFFCLDQVLGNPSFMSKPKRMYDYSSLPGGACIGKRAGHEGTAGQ